MLRSRMRLTRVAVAMAFSLQVGSISAGASANKEGEAKQVREPTRTGKERLGGKASDEQRVDNCNVPVDLRGPTPRPDSCVPPRQGEASR
jgi:hypothetical protein